jgi:hypothetical protein
MGLGEYLERLDSRIRLSNERGYSTVAISKEKLYDILSNVADKFRVVGIWGTAAIRASYFVLGTLAVKDPNIRQLVGILIMADVITDALLPLGGIIHPDRWAQLRKFRRTSIVTVGLYKSIGYSIYIRYIYMLYGLLNSVMSIIKNFYEHLAKSLEVPIDQLAKELTEKNKKKKQDLNKRKIF